MKVASDLTDRVEAIDWFSLLGADTRPSNLPGEFVPSLAAAADSLADASWERVTSDAAGRLTSWLHRRCRSEYQSWNEIVREAKVLVERTAVRAVLDLSLSDMFGEVLIDCVRWDVANAIAELSYSRCRPPAFFQDLLTVYESGHLPCGWVGDWPSGTLLYV